MILSYIYLIAFVIIIYSVNRKNKQFFILIFLFLYAQLWTIMSCLYIESGIFITEQKVFSFFTGATIRLIIYNFVFFLIISILTSYLIKNRSNRLSFENSNFRLYKVVLIIILSIIIVLLINMIISGTPLFSHGLINRFTFWSDYAIYKKLNRLLRYIPFYSSLLGCVYVYSDNKSNQLKHTSLSIFLLLLIYLILQGNKFTGVFLASYFFLIPLFIYGKKEKKIFFTKKIIFSIALLVLGIFLLSYLEYKFVLNVDNPISFIFYRIFGLQGHIWWGTDLMVKSGYVNQSQHLTLELANIVKPDNMSTQTGMKFLMLLVGGDNAQRFIDIGVNFTMGYPAILIVTFGKLGTIIFQSIIAIVLSFILSHAVNSIKAGRLIDSGLTLQLVMNFYLFLSMGRFSDLFNIENFILILILWLLEFDNLIKHKRLLNL